MLTSYVDQGDPINVSCSGKKPFLTIDWSNTSVNYTLAQMRIDDNGILQCNHSMAVKVLTCAYNVANDTYFLDYQLAADDSTFFDGRFICSVESNVTSIQLFTLFGSDTIFLFPTIIIFLILN